MADTTWPSALRDLWLRNAFQEVLPKNIVRTEMDQGPPKVRRRSTSNIGKIRGQMFLTAALATSLDTFFNTTTNSGALTIEMKHPRTGTTGTYQFSNEPSYTALNQGYITTIEMDLISEP